MDQFYKGRGKCKVCIAAQKKQYRQDNKEAIAARMQQYHKDNKEAIAAKKQQYYADNQEAIAARQKQYQDNKEAIAASRSSTGKTTGRHSLLQMLRHAHPKQGQSVMLLEMPVMRPQRARSTMQRVSYTEASISVTLVLSVWHRLKTSSAAHANSTVITWLPNSKAVCPILTTLIGKLTTLCPKKHSRANLKLIYRLSTGTGTYSHCGKLKIIQRW